MTKEEIINLIAGRIIDEYRKHSHSIEDWHKIAAGKIYSQWFEFYDKQKKDLHEIVEQLQARINEQKTKYGELVTLYEENLGQLLDAAKQNKQLQAKIDELENANEWISVEELNPEYYEKVLIECSGNLSNDNYSYYDVAVFTRDGWVCHLYKHPSVIKWKKITN